MGQSFKRTIKPQSYWGNGEFNSSSTRITQNIEKILIINNNVLIILKFWSTS